MSKHSAQFKLKVVNDYLGGGGYLRVANHYGINTTDVRKWVLTHKLHGVSALQKRGYQQYTPQFKLLALEHMRANKASPRSTSAQFNIASPSTILVWQRLYNEGGITALEPKPRGRPSMPKRHEIQALLAKPSSELTPDELLRKLHYLEVENAYLKKLEALAQQKELGKQEQAQVVTELRQQYPLQTILGIANMPRSVYYYQLSVSNKTDPYLDVKTRIGVIYHRHKGRYGYRRVQTELGHEKCHLNPKTVQKLMSKLGLKSTVRPKRYQSYKGPEGKAAPNLLERKFNATEPNQKWVTDVTQFNIAGKKVYLSPVLDLYNQEIISYEIADHPQMSMVMQMLNKAFKRLQPKDKLMLHSDQGWHYRIAPYQMALKQKGVAQSMSRKGNCLDNAVMENWFGIMKTEFFYQKKFDDVQTFKTELKEYIHYYNHDRIKQKLKGLSPVQYRTQSLLVT